MRTTDCSDVSTSSMLVAAPTSPPLSVMATDDSMSDDVFESPGEDLLAPRAQPPQPTPSPTGYRDYKPPAEALRMYSQQNRDAEELAEQMVHKTILLGDSGVGKTSLLVQFDTGRFQTGNFSATVGIGFTVSTSEAPGVAMDTSDDNMSEHVVRHVVVSRRNSQTTAGVIRQPQRHHEDSCDLVCKVMLLGDSGVGKTCLLVRFRDGLFLSGNFITTVGIDFRNKVVTVDQSKVKLQIWDTAGQERFRSVTHAYYRDAHALLLLYDVTNKISFDNIRAWLGEIREYAQDDVVIMLLGNKADCGSERLVMKEDGERLAREYNVAFMETSAKTGLNVELTFMAVARELKSRKCGNQDENKFNVQDYVREQSQRASCPPCNA